MNNRLSIVVTTAMLFAAATFGAVISVPNDYPTIQMAINAAIDGDEVVVSSGIYTGQISITKIIVLRSTDPTNPAVVAATILTSDINPGSGITLYSANCVISGLTIKGFTNSIFGLGGGINGNGETATIQYCRIVNNFVGGVSSESHGGGIAFLNGVIRNNVISGNGVYCQDGGGGLYACNGVITNNIISNNGYVFCSVGGPILGGGLLNCGGLIEGNFIYRNSSEEGGGLAECSGTIQNNLIWNNQAASGGGGLYACSGVIRNNTIVGNAAIFGGGVSSCNSVLTNCIIWANGTGSQVDNDTPYPAYSCIQNWNGFGVGNTSSDPKFLNAGSPAGVDGIFGNADDGFHLLVGSPCIDTGTSLSAPATDITGIARPQGAGIDMGAYEGSAPNVSAGPNLTVILPAAAVLNGSAISSNALVATWSEVSGVGNVTFGNSNSTSTTATFSMPGVYVLRLTANDGVVSASSDATANVIQCTYLLSATNADFDAAGGGDNVVVSTTNLCTWAATSSVPWIVIVGGGTSTTGSATVAYTVLSYAPNTNSRTGTMTIAGQTFTVAQAGCTYSLSSTLPSFAAVGSTSTVLVATTSVCPWMATTSNTWLTILSGANGTGSETVVFTVSPNATSNTRTGTINIANQDCVVVQTGNVPPQVSISAVPPTTLPVNTVNLVATATDDGAPYGTLTTTWSTISGPGTVSFGNPNAANTTATFSTNGTYVLRLTANDGALSASNDVTVIVNARPRITTPPTVASNALLQAGNLVVVPALEPIPFTVGAFDPDGNSWNCQWVSCENVTNTDCDPVYVFSNCGPCVVNVTITDNVAAAVSSNFTVTVPCLLNITKLQGTLNFAKTNADSCTVKGTFSLPATNSFAGKLVTLDIGGTNVSFTLDSKGKWHNGLSTFSKPTYNKSHANWTFNATLKSGSWQSTWAEYSMINSNIPKPGILVTNFPVILVLDTEAFMGTTNLHYTAKAGKSGTAK